MFYQKNTNMFIYLLFIISTRVLQGAVETHAMYKERESSHPTNLYKIDFYGPFNRCA